MILPQIKKKAVKGNQFPTHSHVIVVIFFNFSQALLESAAQHMEGKNLPMMRMAYLEKKKKGTVLNWTFKNE